jgi:hypothetical protein
MSRSKTPKSSVELVNIPFVEFVTEVLGLSLSRAWWVLLTVAVDGVEPAQLSKMIPASPSVANPERLSDRQIASNLFGDVDVVPKSVRELLIWRLGRGSGKTTIAAALGVWTMLTSPLDAVGPGMVAAVVVIAPRKKTATLSVKVARALVKGCPGIERFVMKDGDTQEGFSIMRPDANRPVSFVAVPAARGGETLRGYDILALILDESEFFTSNTETASDDGYAVSDRDLYAAAEPRLLGHAIFISTPWPVDNMTAEFFEKNFGDPRTALVARGTSLFMRPENTRLKEKIAKALANDEENASREYLCVSGGPGGSRLFDKESVELAMSSPRPLVSMVPRGAFIGAGGDLGLERDSSAICIVSQYKKRFELHEFDEIRPTKDNPLAPAYVIKGRFAPIMRAHRATGIMMDAHYRQSAKEHLDSEGLKFLHAPDGSRGKYDSYMFFRALLREGRVSLPDIARLKTQLLSVVSKALPGGGTKIIIPRRMGQAHGDIVSALVLACWSAKKKTRDKVTEAPEIKTRSGGDYARINDGYSGRDDLPIDGGGGQNISFRRARRPSFVQPAEAERRRMSATRPPKGEGMTPGEKALASHGWVQREEFK